MPSDPIERLVHHARTTSGLLTLAANYTPSATRSPSPDWAASVTWISNTTPPEPVTIYGAGATPEEAAEHALDQLTPPSEHP